MNKFPHLARRTKKVTDTLTAICVLATIAFLAAPAFHAGAALLASDEHGERSVAREMVLSRYTDGHDGGLAMACATIRTAAERIEWQKGVDRIRDRRGMPTVVQEPIDEQAIRAAFKEAGCTYREESAK